MVEGAAAGSAVAGLGHYLLTKKHPYYRSLPITIKTLGLVLCVAPAVAFQAERRGLLYDKEHNW